MIARLGTGLLCAFLVAGVTAATLNSQGYGALTALEEARLEALAARQEVMRLQGELARAQADLGLCAGARGQLELLVHKAVIDAKMAGFVTAYEADHPGQTWSFEQKGPVPKPKP